MPLEEFTQPTEDGEQPGQNHSLFYNVMPTAKSGLFSTPTRRIEPLPGGNAAPAAVGAQSAPITIADLPSHHSGKLKLIIVPILIVLLAGAAYALWLMKQERASDKQAIKPPGAAAKGTTETEEKKEETSPVATTPKEWLSQYFGSAACKEENKNVCGDAADSDRDGLTNKEEFDADTDPNNSDSDRDGLADGDEVNVFSCNPSKATTASDLKYNDADYARGGFDTATKQLFTSERISEVKANMRAHGLHQPTLTTLGDALLDLYGFSGTGDSAETPQLKGAEVPAGTDTSPEAKLDRDAQRLVTIKKVGVGLVKYKIAGGAAKYPETADFTVIAELIKPYLTSATNLKDPIDVDPYKYKYLPATGGASFTLTYYSETQDQLIKYKSVDAEREASAQGATNNDEQRKSDLEAIYSALLIYSANKASIDGTGSYIFPTSQNYKTELVPTYISSIPKDPVTGKDYEYKVSENLNTFTLKTVLENPTPGTTGYMCNQIECTEF